MRKKTSLLSEWKHRVGGLKREVLCLYLAYRDPRTPWYAKAAAIAVIAYAVSPIDLIPDFIPFFGYLDDLIIVPIGIWFAIRLIPGPVLMDSRQKAQKWIAAKNRIAAKAKWIAFFIILAIWLLAFWLLAKLIWGLL